MKEFLTKQNIITLIGVAMLIYGMFTINKKQTVSIGTGGMQGTIISRDNFSMLLIIAGALIILGRFLKVY